MNRNDDRLRDVVRRWRDNSWDRMALSCHCRDLFASAERHAEPAICGTRCFCRRTVEFLTSHHRDLLRYSLAIVFIWFGGLKPLGISPANALVERTVPWFPAEWFIPFLGLVEVAIGLGLIVRRFTPAALVLLFLQMAGTMLPLVTLIDICYTDFPFGLTLEGQYIIKNLVLISAAISIALGATKNTAETTQTGGASESTKLQNGHDPLARSA